MSPATQQPVSAIDIVALIQERQCISRRAKQIAGESEAARVNLATVQLEMVEIQRLAERGVFGLLQAKGRTERLGKRLLKGMEAQKARSAEMGKLLARATQIDAQLISPEPFAQLAQQQ